MIVRVGLLLGLLAWAGPGVAQTPLPSPDPVLPPPAQSTRYTVPDTGLDLSLVPPPVTQPGERMTIAPAMRDAPELTLEIPIP